MAPLSSPHAFTPAPVQRKMNENLPAGLQHNMENAFGHDFSRVSIQRESTKATEINARAFTQGEEIHFAPGEFNTGSESGKNLIGHEFTHVVQQRNGVVNATSVMGKGLSLNDDTGLEREADLLGQKAVNGETIPKYRSAGLGIRNALRGPVQAKSNVIQRDIKGSQDLTKGKMELDFTKHDAATAGDPASESGTVKFTPNKTAPNSNRIRLIQIVSAADVGGVTTAAGNPTDWSAVGAGEEADRNKMTTTADAGTHVEGGFFVDHSAAIANPRTHRRDRSVSPYYRTYWPNSSLSHDGYKRSKTERRSASLADQPGSNIATKFSFVTSAKGADTGTWYGSALWDFEIYLDGGVAKIKNENKSFQDDRGATTDAALQQFNEFYKNPGTAGAPTK